MKSKALLLKRYLTLSDYPHMQQKVYEEFIKLYLTGE